TVTGVNTYGYTAPTNASNPIIPTVGYLCYIGPVPLTVDLTGPPVKFGQTFSVTYTPSAGAYNDGWVLLGNPYPSAIDWTSAAWSKHNVNNAVYVWNDALQQYSSWVSGVSVNGGSNIIASSQSFWVQTNGASPTLSCTENVKVSANPKFLMPDSIAAFSILKLIMTGNNYKDETFMRFGNGATNKFDASLDAYKIFSSNTSVPGIASEDSTLRDMSINSMPPITSALYVPIKALVGTSGNYTIKLDSSSVIPQGSCLELLDKVTGIKTNIDNFSSYSFSISDTTKAARFILHIAPCGTITGGSQLTDQIQLNAFPNPTTGLVTVNYRVNNSNSDNVIMQVIDLGTGQVVMEKSVPDNSNQMQIDLTGFASGVYALNMLSNSNASEHIKIIKLK
ncbi:MAG TPA: T9SS type A sorting domain-containing protein, partial [Bacteroidia bacterium]|nr:T9SS type A sorting domain-containing protein [Bacteroidia bacterium]